MLTIHYILSRERFRLLRPFIKADRAEVVQASITHIPLQNSSMDAVFHVESVYFWPSLPDGLCEILRVLKPGGIVVTTFNPRLIDRYVRWGWMRFGRPDYLAYAIALEQLGFEGVEWIKNDPRAPRGVQCIRARKPALGLLTK
nr:type 11 methyltransferase [Hymenolepis microstoma]